jgi:hypothetical protein
MATPGMTVYIRAGTYNERLLLKCSGTQHVSIPSRRMVEGAHRNPGFELPHPQQLFFGDTCLGMRSCRHRPQRGVTGMYRWCTGNRDSGGSREHFPQPNGFLPITNNVVHDGGKEGIDAKDGASNGIISGNHVYNQRRSPGIYVDAWDKHELNIEVYGNISHDNFHGFCVAAEN